MEQTLLYLALGAAMGGVIYLFLKRKDDAKVIPFNPAEREAVKKAQAELERGVEEARIKYLKKKQEFLDKRNKNNK